MMGLSLTILIFIGIHLQFFKQSNNGLASAFTITHSNKKSFSIKSTIHLQRAQRVTHLHMSPASENTNTKNLNQSVGAGKPRTHGQDTATASMTAVTGAIL